MYTDQKCGQKIPAWWHPCFDEATNKSVNLAVWKKVCGRKIYVRASALSTNFLPECRAIPRTISAWPKARLRPLRRCVVSSVGSGGTERLDGADRKKPRLNGASVRIWRPTRRDWRRIGTSRCALSMPPSIRLAGVCAWQHVAHS